MTVVVAGFAGDIDNVRLFDRIIQMTDIVADEPAVQTTLVIDVVALATVGEGSPIWVTLSPKPARPGRFRHVLHRGGWHRARGPWADTEPVGCGS